MGKHTKYYMLFVEVGGHLRFALLNENPLTFVYSEKDENGIRFSGKEYNHYQSVLAKLRKMNIEGNIVEWEDYTQDELLKLFQKQEENKKIKALKIKNSQK
jgi:hypothetical protein